MKREVTRDEFLQKRAERQRKIRKRRLTTFFVTFIIFLLVVGVVLSLTVFFPIETMKASGSKIYTSEQIIAYSGIEVGDNLFLANANSITTKLKNSLPYVESVSFKKELPGTLKITVKDAEEFACYKVGGKYYTVSQSGWVLEENTKPNSKIVLINAQGVKCKVGTEISFSETSHKDMIETLALTLKEENLKVNSIDVTNILEITAKVEGRFEVKFGNSNDLQSKARHLSAMIKKISKDKKGKIDLSIWTNVNTKGTFVAE